MTTAGSGHTAAAKLRTRRGRITATVGILGLVAAVAACSSSSSSGSSSNTGASSATQPIKVMVEGAISGPVYALPEMVTGAKVAVQQINAAGGINGRQLQLVTCDDQGNPNNAAACAQQAVSEGVVALVGGISIYDDELLPPLQKASIPDIASYDISNSDHTSPVSFPININAVDYAGFGELLAKSGCTRAAGLAPDQGGTTIIDQDLSYVSGAFEKNGGTSFKNVIFPLTATNLTSDVAVALGGGATCIGMITGPQQTVEALTAVQGTGKDIKMATNLATIVPALYAPLHLPSGQLLVSGAYFSPGPEQTNPAVAKFVKAMQNSSAKGQAAAIDTESENAYNAVLIFQEATKGMTDITGPNVLKAMNTLTTDTGLTPPVNFGSSPILASKPRDRVKTEVPYIWTGSALQQSGPAFTISG